jgi:hypothetical protein
MLKLIKRTELQRLLKSNICDLLIVRRRPERAPGRPELRQMLCTNSMEILRSENGLRVLNYSGSFEPKKVDERKHNLVVTWDIFMQDYRNVSMDMCYLVQKIPADDNFWKFFNENIFPMSPNEKMRYMDIELNLDTYQ